MAILLVTLLVASLALCRQTSASIAIGPQWVRVESRPLVLTLGLVGRLAPARRVVITAPFDGVVEDMPVAEGQRIERGQRLLSVDTAQLDVQGRSALGELIKAQRAVQEMENWEQSPEVGRSRRGLVAARIGLADTERRLAEARVLLQQGIVPRMEVDALEQQAQTQHLDVAGAESDLRANLARGRGGNRVAADIELASARARHEAIEALRSQRNIESPYSGTLMRMSNTGAPGIPGPVTVQRGTRVTQGQSLFELVSLERMQVVARVEEMDVQQLREGMAVEITGDGFEGLVLRGQLQSIGVVSQQAEGWSDGVSYEVVVAMPALAPDQQQRLRLGMSARVSIITYRNETAMVVPHQALHIEGGRARVTYRAQLGSEVQSVEVRTGRSLPDGVEVFGLTAGEVEVVRDVTDGAK
ncbi:MULTISPECIES: efflux RND transporter periplasmic adaptor subunit [Cupriavidus]